MKTKIGYLYHYSQRPDDIHLCIKFDEPNNEVYFKQLSGDFTWFYYDDKEKLWRASIYWVEKYMVELGPDCKAYRAIYL